MTNLILTNGQETKNLNPFDLDSNPEAWTFFSNAPQSEIDSMFYKVAASYRAVNKRATMAANVPFEILKGKTVIDDSTKWENKVGFLPDPVDLIRRISLSISFANKAYLLRGKNALQVTKALNFLVPTTITEVTNPATGLFDYFERRVNGRAERYQFNDPNFIHIWQMDHTVELLPSKNTAAQAVMNATGQLYWTDLFVSNFFQRGGIKPTVLALKGAVWSDRKEEIERGWNRFIRNLSKFSTKLLNAESMDVKPIGSGVDDLKNNDIYKQAISNIALGFGMPVSELMSDFDSFATAQVDRMSWLRDDIFPHVGMIAAPLNEQVFKPLGLHLKFRTETTDAETQDEVDRAEAYSKYVEAGIKPSVAAQMVGIELPDGVEYIDLDKMMDEKKKEDDAKQQAERDQQMALQAAKQPAPAVAEKKPAAPVAKWIPSLDHLQELRVYRKAAMQRLKKSESLDFDYLPHFGGLPDDVSADIRAALVTATTEEEVKAAFELDYPTETITPTPEYKTSEIVLLAEALNNLAAKSIPAPLPAQQAPNVNITMSPISLTAQMPDQKEATIVFSPNIQASDVINQTTVNVEPTPLTVENHTTVQPATVRLDVPLIDTVEKDIARDNSTGMIKKTKDKYTYKK